MDVKLVTWTSRPIETMYWAFQNMHNNIDNNLDSIILNLSDKDKFLEMLMSQPHQTVLEFVNTVWYIGGCSRAFQQQLTRTRQAAYSIQSLRVVNVRNFANEKKFYIPGSIKNKKLYERCMMQIQSIYKDMLEMGENIEDARGILPLNICSPITMSINLRALFHMLELRMCNNTQEEFREVAKLMKQELKIKIDSCLASFLKPFCDKKGYCNSTNPCGKYEIEVNK